MFLVSIAAIYLSIVSISWALPGENPSPVATWKVLICLLVPCGSVAKSFEKQILKPYIRKMFLLFEVVLRQLCVCRFAGQRQSALSQLPLCCTDAAARRTCAGGCGARAESAASWSSTEIPSSLSSSKTQPNADWVINYYHLNLYCQFFSDL